MSDLGLGTQRPTGHRKAPRRRQSRGCLVPMLALILIVALGFLAYVKGVAFLKDRLAGPEDYSGSGTGNVVVEVKQGDTATDIGRTLKAAGVVKSVDAFIQAADANPQSTSVQVGFYQLHKQMAAENALNLLLDPKQSMVVNAMTIPEGKRADEIVDIVAEAGGFSKASVKAALADTKALGLPAYAHGDVEGYLWPATYNLAPDATPAGVLKMLVDQFKVQADDAKLEQGAQALGRSAADVVTVASLIQAEASRSEDMPKVASVIYNRLDQGMPLQLDSTLHYAIDSRGVVQTSASLRNLDSPYNTYKYPGLPPTPIDSPGRDALDAALHPADTNYLYFVTVNLATGKTLFASTFAEHEQNVQKYIQYCQTSDAC